MGVCVCVCVCVCVFCTRYIRRRRCATYDSTRRIHRRYHAIFVHRFNGLQLTENDESCGNRTCVSVRVCVCVCVCVCVVLAHLRAYANAAWVRLRELRKILRSFAIDQWDDRKAVALNFNEFLQGMAVAQQHESTKQWINVLEPNRWELLSLIIDTPVSLEEEERIYESMSVVERIGVDLLRRKRQEMDMDRVRFVLEKAAGGSLSKLDQEQRDKMKRLHFGAVM